MERPQCTCGCLVMPGLQMLAHRGTVELYLKGWSTLELWEFDRYSSSCPQASPQDANLLLTKTVSI